MEIGDACRCLQPFETPLYLFRHHPSETVFRKTAVGHVSLRPAVPYPAVIFRRESSPMLVFPFQGLSFIRVLLPPFQPVAQTYLPLAGFPGHLYEMVPYVGGQTHLIAGPWEIGIVAIGHELEFPRWLPGGSHIDTTFILDATALAETPREERVVFLAVKPLYSHQREIAGGLPTQGIQRGNGPAGTRCRFAVEGQPRPPVTVIHAGIPDIVALGVVGAVDGCGGRVEVAAQVRESPRYSRMETLVEVVQVPAGHRLFRIVLLVHLRLRAVVAVRADGLDIAVVRQRSINLPPRGKHVEVQPLQQFHLRCCPLQIVRLHRGRMRADIVLTAAQRGQHPQFSQREVVVDHQSHAVAHPVAPQSQRLQPSHIPQDHVVRIEIIARFVPVGKERLPRILGPHDSRFHVITILKAVAQVMPVRIPQIALIIPLPSVERNLSRCQERMTTIFENLLPVRESHRLLLADIEEVP